MKNLRFKRRTIRICAKVTFVNSTGLIRYTVLVIIVRHGFPILDRVGHQYFPTVGYMGAIRLMEMILGVLMDRQDRDAPEESFELTV